MRDPRLPYPVYPALPAPGRGQPPPRGRRLWVAGLAAAVFLLGLGALGYGYFLLGPTGVTAVVRIPRGAGAYQVAEVLEAAGLVRDATAFALYARATGKAGALRSGVYRLEGRGVPQLLEDLSGRQAPLAARLTFPEGWRAVEYAARLEANGFDGRAYLERVRDPPAELTPEYVEGPTLEGYLFPATYTIPLDATPEEILRMMLERFEQELTPERRARLAELGLSVHAWVTLASIVQAEAGSVEEMPYIAGVFLNRLDAGLPLQSDPTVAYALGKRLPELDRFAGDFEVDSPYNTYKRVGLPPGPINNPGRAALEAVLNAKRFSPAGKPYLFFFHARGELYLNEDFGGHLRDLNRYRYAP
ncbi:endolytic transglycosylase MltG [Marinithermus hydrothermalis]|uniref:Endolytic murein transglycosylase n=1 Tax=Marinithermus hydrothermalis (strain DSM 14884 / JCM 11576 / T1) TaxID=869210 RepID=F2NQ41_MARHT|nr:aminodeoxychorismate lyase [Marinithermus hydrothermalis DSM 14884]